MYVLPIIVFLYVWAESFPFPAFAVRLDGEHYEYVGSIVFVDDAAVQLNKQKNTYYILFIKTVKLLLEFLNVCLCTK